MNTRLPLALVAALFLASACSGSDDASSGAIADAETTEQPAEDQLLTEATGDDTAVDADAADDAAVSGPAPEADSSGDDVDAGDAAVSGPAPGAEPSAEDAAENPIAEDDMFPDVVGASATDNGGTWTVSATLSSPYDTPERYADAWRVVGPDGTVYGERILTHDHANEQPFTRSQSGIEIPADVDTVVIEGRDLEFGWGGDTFELELSR